MQFEELTTVATADLPSSELADYLQLQTGATGVVRQDQHLDSSLLAALCEVEARSGRFLLKKKIEASSKSRKLLSFQFGKADGVQIEQVFIRGEEEIILTSDKYEFTSKKFSCDLKIRTASIYNEWGARLFVGHQHWDDVNADLRMAVLTLAAHFYENRFDRKMQNDGMPKLVESLIEKHRTLRLLRG